MGFDVSIPIGLICSKDCLLCLGSATTAFWHAGCRRGPATPTNGRSRGVATDVRRDPVANRSVAGTARASMKGLRGGKALITIGEVRLDGGKATSSSAPRQPILGYAPHGIRHGGCLLRLRPKKARRSPSRSRESGECRLKSIRPREGDRPIAEREAR